MYITDLFDVAHSVFSDPWIFENSDFYPKICRFCGVGYPDHNNQCASVRFFNIREKAWKEKQALEEVVESSLDCLFHGQKPTHNQFMRAANAFRELEIAQMPPEGSP